MIEDQEEEKRILNKDKPEMNRGVELLLRNRRRTEKPKTFQVKFGKLIALWNREIIFHFNEIKTFLLLKQPCIPCQLQLQLV